MFARNAANSTTAPNFGLVPSAMNPPAKASKMRKYGEKVEKYVCPRCPKEYQSWNDLKLHFKRIHGVEIVERERQEKV